MADLFSGKEKLDISKLQLSEFTRQAPKPIVEKKKIEKRLNKVSGVSTPPFRSEEERLKHFPNPPISLKELRKKYKHVAGKKIASFNWDTKELTFHGYTNNRSS